MYRNAVPASVDLHGLSVEAALYEVDRELNHTFIQETEDRRVEFITGWGSKLRPEVMHFLENHPLVKEIEILGPKIRVHLEDGLS